MRLPRIHTPGPLQEGAEITLTPSAANHVARVLRLGSGDAIAIFDGDGNEFHATIAAIKGQRVTVRLNERVANGTESPLRITLVQGISRGERMDFVVQKAVELGVTSIEPVLTARSVVKLDRNQAAKKQEHWRSIAAGACEQSGRSRVPIVATPISLREFLGNAASSLKVPTSGVTPLVLDPQASHALAATEIAPTHAREFVLLIGPEGGLSDEEVAAARDAGFIPVRLGPRILRTETAAIAALTALQVRWGDLA